MVDRDGMDWVKKCMVFRVEGRRPVLRPRRTLLESVEADMAELEIDKEDVHDRKKWNVMKRKSTLSENRPYTDNNIVRCIPLGSGMKRVHVVLSVLRMRLFVCVHVCISCRYYLLWKRGLLIGEG